MQQVILKMKASRYLFKIFQLLEEIKILIK